MKVIDKGIFQTIRNKFSKQPTSIKNQRKMENDNIKNAEKENTQIKPEKKHSLTRIVRNLFQRFLVVFVRFIARYVVYGEHGLSVPPPENLILLDSATALASKIRNKKVKFLSIFLAIFFFILAIVSCPPFSLIFVRHFGWTKNLNNFKKIIHWRWRAWMLWKVSLIASNRSIRSPIAWSMNDSQKRCVIVKRPINWLNLEQCPLNSWSRRNHFWVCQFQPKTVFGSRGEL